MRPINDRPELRGGLTALALVTAIGAPSDALATPFPRAQQEAAMSDVPPSDRIAMASVLDASAAAWSRGDLDGFMACYEVAPDTIYLKPEGPVRGFAAVRAMYAARFRPHGRGMGRLTTELSNVRALGPAHALVVGRYRLARTVAEGGDATGVFTLVFHRGPQGWRIISDHTS